MLKKKLKSVSSILIKVSAILLLNFISPSNGFVEDKHPIDKWYSQCLDKDSSTLNMLNCTSKAYEMWDKELNKIYQSLIKKLSIKEKEILKESQRNWLKFRDSEFKFMDEIIKEGGTLNVLANESAKVEFIKKENSRIDKLS